MHPETPQCGNRLKQSPINELQHSRPHVHKICYGLDRVNIERGRLRCECTETGKATSGLLIEAIRAFREKYLDSGCRSRLGIEPVLRRLLSEQCGLGRKCLK